MQMIREELKEMFDGMEPSSRKELYELSSQEQAVVNDLLTSVFYFIRTDELFYVSSSAYN